MEYFVSPNYRRTWATTTRIWSWLLPIVLILVALFANIPASYAEGKTVRLLSYHNHPPFVTGDKQGLIFDIAESLNRHAAGKWRFSVRIVPRSRLNLELAAWTQDKCDQPQSKTECNDDWSTLWVNPSWGFGKNAKKNFRWVKIFQDSNAIISHRDSPIEYKGPESLEGLRFGAMRGHRYTGIDNLVKLEQIQRIDSNKERDNVLMLLMKRLDVILLPTSTIDYFLNKDATLRAAKDKIYSAPTKHQHYWRYFMLPGSRPDLEEFYQEWLQTVGFFREASGE